MCYGALRATHTDDKDGLQSRHHERPCSTKFREGMTQSLMSRYGALSGTSCDDDIAVSVMVDFGVKDFRDKCKHCHRTRSTEMSEKRSSKVLRGSEIPRVDNPRWRSGTAGAGLEGGWGCAASSCERIAPDQPLGYSAKAGSDWIRTPSRRSIRHDGIMLAWRNRGARHFMKSCAAEECSVGQLKHTVCPPASHGFRRESEH